jgi:uncharacterized SAM-binding protein YcdF (DUF218 family)
MQVMVGHDGLLAGIGIAYEAVPDISRRPLLFFVLSKTLGIMLLPTNLLIGLGLLGAVLLKTRLVRLGRKLLIASVVLLGICGFSPIGNWLLYPLEQRFPPWDGARGAPDGIVVLGGGIDADVSAAHRTTVFTSASGRIIVAAALAYRYPKARIIYSAGSANLVSDDAAKEADYVLAVFESLGVSRGRIMSERLSRNTFENAEFSKELAAPKNNERWLLVTSAYHMPRSIGIFRKIGFAVEAFPADWRLAGVADLLKFSVLSVETLAHTDLALREWTGLAAYRLSGKTNAFFPGPNPE